MNIALLIIGGVLLLAALITAFMPRAVASVAAWAALVCFYVAAVPCATWMSIACWGVAALMVIGINSLQGWPMKRIPRLANAYVAGGALVGAVVGLIISIAGLIVGAALGALFGGIAFSRTPGGRDMVFPSPRFWRLMLTLGLPAVVVMSISGHIIGALLAPAVY